MNNSYQSKGPEIIGGSSLSIPVSPKGPDTESISLSGTIPFNSDPRVLLAQECAKKPLEVTKLEASQAIGETSQK